MAWEAITALKDIALEQKDNQWSLSLKEDFHKKFESPQNRKKLYEAAKDGLKNLDEASKNTLKQGVENIIKWPEFQKKFEDIKKIDTTTWLNKGALTSEQRGMVSLMYLYGWLKGEKNASPQDVITIFDRTKSGENQPVKPIEKIKTPIVSEEVWKISSKDISIPQSINKTISIAQPKQLEKPAENIKSFSDIAENLDPSIKDNQEVSKILRKIKRLEKRLDDNDSWEELKEKQKELSDIENKIIDKTNEIQKQDTYINEVLSKNPNLSFLIPENQEKLTDLKKENSELTAQKKEIEEDIKDIESENKKEINKDQNKIQEIKEQVTKLQNHLSNNKKDLNNQREVFRNNISDLQKMIVWEDVLNNIPEERTKDISKIIENNNKIEPQLENLKKQFDTITAKIEKIDSFIGDKWQINTYLAQYDPKGSTEQPATIRPDIANAKPKEEITPAAKAEVKSVTNTAQAQNMTPNSTGEKIGNTEITPNNISEKLTKISPKDLFEGEKWSEGEKIFNYIHENWSNLSEDMANNFMWKLKEQYGSFNINNEELGYNLEPLTNTTNDSGEKVFQTYLNVIGSNPTKTEKIEFNFWPTA